MATTSKPSAATAAAVLLVLVATAALLAPAGASTLTVFTGPGCSGKSKDVNYVCGCFDISYYQGGYHFVFTEDQEAYLHASPYCADPYPVHLKIETRHCKHTGFKSVQMVC